MPTLKTWMPYTDYCLWLGMDSVLGNRGWILSKQTKLPIPVKVTYPHQHKWHINTISVFLFCVCVCAIALLMSDSLWPYGLWPTRLLCLWDSPGKNTGVVFYALFQGIFPTQGSNTSLFCLLHWQPFSLPLAPLGSPLFILVWINIWHLFQ